MKKSRKLYTTIASLVALGAILIGAYFYTGRADAQKQAAIPKVGILQLMSHPALDQIHQGIDDTLKKMATLMAKTSKLNSKTLKGIKVI